MGRAWRRAMVGGVGGALLLLVTVVTAGAAVHSIALQPTSGLAGSSTTVTGSGWGQYEGQTVGFFWDTVGPKPSASSTIGNGAFTRALAVPGNASAGDHLVIACIANGKGGCTASASAKFTVTVTTTTTTGSTTTLAGSTTSTSTTVAPGSTSTTTTTVAPGTPPPLAPRIDADLIGTPGVGIGTGLYGPATVLRLPADGPSTLPDLGFVPRCVPPPAATVIDFDDLEVGADVSEAYASLGVHMSADNIPNRAVDRSPRAERLEVFAPEVGTISAPNGMRWVPDGPRLYGHNLLEIRFDTPQRVVGFYVGQVGPGDHGQLTLDAGSFETRGPPHDEIFVDGGSALTSCMLISNPDGSSFDRVVLDGANYPEPQLDRLFFSTDPLPAPPPALPARAMLSVRPEAGTEVDLASTYSVSGSVVLFAPVGGFPVGTAPIDEIRITVPNASGTGFITRDTEISRASRDRSNIVVGFRVDGWVPRSGDNPISVTALGPGVRLTQRTNVIGTGAPIRTAEEMAGLVDFQPMGMEITQGLLGAFGVGEVGGSTSDRVTHVAGRSTVVRVYPRVTYPTTTDVRQVAIPIRASLIGLRGGRALPGSPLVASSLEPVEHERTDEELQSMRLDGASAFNFRLPDSWTDAGTIALLAVINPADQPQYLEEAPGSGGLRNAMVAGARFTSVEPRPVHMILAESWWRTGSVVRHASPSLRELGGLLDYWYRTWPVPMDGLPLEPATTYRQSFRVCTADDPPGTICQQPPAVAEAPVWDNAVLVARYGADLMDDDKRRFIPLLFSPSSPIGCSGQAGIGHPTMFHSGACGPTVAQEAGHSMGLNHAGNSHGEAAGGGFQDRFSGDHGQMEPEAVGFDLGTLQPLASELGSAHRHDFMSYGRDDALTWVSLDTWNRLGDALRGTDEANGATAAPRPRLAASYVPGPGFLVSGTLTGERGTLQSLVPMAELEPTAPVIDAELRLEWRDARGAVLGVHNFDPVGRTTHFAEGSFVEALAPVDGATSLVLLRGDDELAQLEAGEATPTISAPKAEVRGSSLRLRWTAKDADDADQVVTWVAAGGRTVAGPFSGSAATVPLSDLGVTDDVTLIVSDGLHAASSPKLPVVVPPAALQPLILGLTGPIVVDPDRVEVRGQLLGATEGVDLTWRLDGEEIGYGPSAWLGALSSGKHTLTLEATAEGSEAGAAKRTFSVDDDRDRDGMGDAWEKAHGLDTTKVDSATDGDGDLLTAIAEQEAGSDPRRLDTDGDRYADGVEVKGGSDPADERSIPVRLHGDPTRAIPILAVGDSGSGLPLPLLLGGAVLVLGAGALIMRRRRSMSAGRQGDAPT